MTSRDLQAQETRRRLLTKSVELIVGRGYDQVTVGEICRSCQVAKGTFYVHFDSKRDILMSILADLNASIGAKLDALAPAEPRTAIEQAVAVHLQSVEAQGKDFTRALLRAFLVEDVGPNNPGSSRRVGPITAALVEGQAQGHFRTDRTPDQLVAWLEAFILGLMTDWCHLEDQAFAQPSFVAVQTFLDGFARVPR